MGTWTRRVPLVIAVVAVVLVGWAATAARVTGMALAPGDPAPNMRGKAPDGSFLHVDYSAYRLTLINFWATWCVPCKNEMPALQKLSEAHAKDGLQVVGVVTGTDTGEAMQSFCDSLGVRYPVIHAPKAVVARWQGVGVLPITFLIDSDGKILRREVGATPEQIEALVRDVEAVLAGRPLPPMVFPETPATATDADRNKPGANGR